MLMSAPHRTAPRRRRSHAMTKLICTLILLTISGSCARFRQNKGILNYFRYVLNRTPKAIEKEPSLESCIGREHFYFERPFRYKNTNFTTMWLHGFKEFTLHSVEAHNPKIRFVFGFPRIAASVCASVSGGKSRRHTFSLKEHHVAFEFAVLETVTFSGPIFSVSDFCFLTWPLSKAEERGMSIFKGSLLFYFVTLLQSCSENFSKYMTFVAGCYLQSYPCDKNHTTQLVDIEMTAPSCSRRKKPTKNTFSTTGFFSYRCVSLED